MNNKTVRLIGLVVALVLLVAAPCFAAADNDNDSAGDNWQFNLAPFYLWGINLEGDLSIGVDKTPGNIPLTKPIDIPFEDVFASLEGAFVVHFEAMHKSNFGFLVDVDYLNIGSDFTTPKGFGLDVDFKVTLAEAAGLYRVKKNNHNFDAIFGLRGYKINPSVSLLNGPTVVDETQDWLDPFVGGRWIWNFAEGWSVAARGDIGGFGIGSDFAWQAVGLFEWQPFQYVSFLAGYRVLDVDYEDGSGNDYFKFDATVHGPLLGVNFKW
jgi:hypothetical protein